MSTKTPTTTASTGPTDEPLTIERIKEAVRMINSPPPRARWMLVTPSGDVYCADTPEEIRSLIILLSREAIPGIFQFDWPKMPLGEQAKERGER